MSLIARRPEDQYPMPIPGDAGEREMWYMGGELNPYSIMAAYRQGFFPWQGDPLGWCSPNPRFVIRPEDWHVPRSLARQLKKNRFKITVSQALSEVLTGCMTINRPGQDGSWLTPAMVEAYTQLGEMGAVLSVEAWYDGNLAGGLYGVLVGSIFVGDSMFSYVSGASKSAFVVLAQLLWESGYTMIDCQVYSDHLAQFGAKEINRKAYMEHLFAERDKKCQVLATSRLVV